MKPTTENKNLAQRRKAQAREDLRRRALNAGNATAAQQLESARLIRSLEARVRELESIVYSEELA